MHIINITVRNKVAVNPAQDRYVCGNSDYIVRFDFDTEWDAYETKTARFIKEDGSYVDQIFSGSECPVPVISDTYKIMVGVYAGNLSTTTAAYVPCKKSILCGGGLPADPAPDVYAQVMETLNKNTLFIVNCIPEDMGQGYSLKWADHTPDEIRAAAEEGKTCLLVYEGRVYTYYGEYVDSNDSTKTLPTFFAPGYYKYGTGMYFERVQVRDNKNAVAGGYRPAKTPNPHKLTLTGAVEAEYDGSAAQTIELLPTTQTAHQMLVSDADGKAVWTDLLAYKTTGTVELLGETVLPVTDEEGAFLYTSPLATLPENGKTYKVTYNGEVRETPCLVHSADGLTAAILGSGFMFGLENDEDAPFGIAISMDDATAEAMLFRLMYISKVEFTGDLTLSISGETTKVKKIDSDYLPDIVGKQIVLTIDADGSVTTDTSFAEAWEMTAAQLQSAITIKDTGYFLASGAIRTKNALDVCKFENTINGVIYQLIQVQWKKIIADESDMGLDTSTQYLQWSTDGISAGGTLIPGLPIQYGLTDGMYLQYNGTRWVGVTIDQLKADLGLS